MVRHVIDTADHLSIVQSSVAKPHPVPLTILHPDPVLYLDPVSHPVPHPVPDLYRVQHLNLVLEPYPVQLPVPDAKPDPV
jgi:hypothetical protein